MQRVCATLHQLIIRFSSASHPHLVRFSSASHPLLIRISGVQRLRNSAYGHELCGLMIMVPYAAWAGYENATEQAHGMIVKYIGYHGGTFDIKFGPEVGSVPLRGVSWAPKLFGPLASADCWDMRLGEWVMCTEEVVSAQTRQQRNQTSNQTRQQHRVSDAVRNAGHRASAHQTRARGTSSESSWLIPAGNIDVWRRSTPEQLPSPGTYSLIRLHI